MNNAETRAADEAVGRALREHQEATAAMNASRETAGKWATIMGDLATGLKRLSDQGNTAHLQRVKDTVNTLPAQEELDEFLQDFFKEKRKSDKALKRLGDLGGLGKLS